HSHLLLCSVCPTLIMRTFPTRRSSDLVISGDHAKKEMETGEKPTTSHGSTSSEESRTKRREKKKSSSNKGKEKKSSSHHKEKKEDRKSTRLNSSHVSISYAVFRLKKKS